MRSIKVFAVAAALVATVQAASAQTPEVALEVSGGYAIPTGDWNEDDVLENGVGFGASVIAMFTPQVGVYAGWETYSFDVDEDEPGVEADATDAGFRAGVSLAVAMPQYPTVTPLVEAGVIYNTLEIEASGGGASAEVESEEALGFEAGLGAAVAVHPRVSIVPMVRFRQHEIEFPDISDETETAQFVVVSLGVRLRL
jgi:opacity protein-like surface antigen